MLRDPCRENINNKHLIRHPIITTLPTNFHHTHHAHLHTHQHQPSGCRCCWSSLEATAETSGCRRLNQRVRGLIGKWNVGCSWWSSRRHFRGAEGSAEPLGVEGCRGLWFELRPRIMEAEIREREPTKETLGDIFWVWFSHRICVLFCIEPTRPAWNHKDLVNREILSL